MILGQLRMGARQAKNAPLALAKVRGTTYPGHQLEMDEIRQLTVRQGRGDQGQSFTRTCTSVSRSFLQPMHCGSKLFKALLWGEQGGAVCATQRCRLFIASLAASWCFFTADWSSIRDVLQLQEQLKYLHCQSKLEPPHSPKVGDWTSFGLHFLFHGWSALSRPFSRTSFYQRPDERHDSFYR